MSGKPEREVLMDEIEALTHRRPPDNRPTAALRKDLRRAIEGKPPARDKRHSTMPSLTALRKGEASQPRADTRDDGQVNYFIRNSQADRGYLSPQDIARGD